MSFLISICRAFNGWVGSWSHFLCALVVYTMCADCVSVLTCRSQCIPAISSVPWYITIIPLVTVLSVRGLKDLVNDMVSTPLSPPRPLCQPGVVREMDYPSAMNAHTHTQMHDLNHKYIRAACIYAPGT